MNCLCLIENLNGKLRNGRGVRLIESVLLSHPACRLEHLLTVKTLFVIADLRNQFQQNPIFQTNTWNNDFCDPGLLHDLLQNNCCRNDHVGSIRAKPEFLDTFLERHSTKLFDK